MNRIALASLFTLAMSSLAFAGYSTPAPVLGLIGGPMGVAFAVVGYGAYRLLRKH